MKQKQHGSLSFAFDLQQVQPLPKLNIGEAYYARQISFYCFCVSNIEATEPAFYVWNETQAGRGPQEISSGVTDFLSNTNFDEATTTLRLFADGCGGQNKNQHLIHSVALWLIKRSPPNLKEECFFFPVRGHSFLPADRVFGRLEKKLCTIPEIVTPEKYKEVYNDAGKTRDIGKDWKLNNYKKLSKVWKKIERISEMKRIILKKSKLAVKTTKKMSHSKQKSTITLTIPQNRSQH
ncbi:hypothetical protein ANN_15315 [Periplaneta americana]|uniref:Uncharacterized protein n=1 Tax=Periplaneta americana TaxID=6978 RepID=A0ABQ8SGH1_PERAM|nr:hypothetical protein ANN_15315 [Periplaneta americana]